jgi:hypothetical protein
MAQVVVIGSFNTNSGKTLLTAHLGVILASLYQTAVADATGQTSSLAFFIGQRYAYNLAHASPLVVPNYHSLSKGIFEEMVQKYDVLLLDSPDFSYWAKADVMITPVNSKEGVQALCAKDSPYAALLWQAKKERAAAGKNAFRHIVVPNGSLEEADLELLRSSGKLSGFVVAPGLSVRPVYDSGLKSGITVWDKDGPAFVKLFDLNDLYARRELKQLAEFIWRKA